MKTKLGKDLLKSYLRMVLAQKQDFDIYSVLRSYSQPSKPVDEADLSYILRKDPDVYKASDLDDVSDMISYEFQMYDENGNTDAYRFAIYILKFSPDKPKEIHDINVDVDGRDMDLKKEEIASLINQGKANKYVAGVEKKDDKSEPFNYEALGIEAPQAKMEYVIGYDDKSNSIKPYHQINEIKNEYSGYTKLLAKKVGEYNKSVADKIGKEVGGEAGAMGAAPAGGLAGMPPPPMGGGMPGAPPMPI